MSRRGNLPAVPSDEAAQVIKKLQKLKKKPPPKNTWTGFFVKAALITLGILLLYLLVRHLTKNSAHNENRSSSSGSSASSGNKLPTSTSHSLVPHRCDLAPARAANKLPGDDIHYRMGLFKVPALVSSSSKSLKKTKQTIQEVQVLLAHRVNKTTGQLKVVDNAPRTDFDNMAQNFQKIFEHQQKYMQGDSEALLRPLEGKPLTFRQLAVTQDMAAMLTAQRSVRELNLYNCGSGTDAIRGRAIAARLRNNNSRLSIMVSISVELSNHPALYDFRDGVISRGKHPVAHHMLTFSAEPTRANYERLEEIESFFYYQGEHAIPRWRNTQQKAKFIEILERMKPSVCDPWGGDRAKLSAPRAVGHFINHFLEHPHIIEMVQTFSERDLEDPIIREVANKAFSAEGDFADLWDDSTSTPPAPSEEPPTPADSDVDSEELNFNY